MRCPTCNSDTRTLETREHKHNLYVRTHSCKCGARFRSVQLLEAVYINEPLPPIEQLPRARPAPAQREYKPRARAAVALPDTPATWMRGL